MAFGPFGAWVAQQAQAAASPAVQAVAAGPTLPIGESKRPIQPVRHVDYPELASRDWITVLRLYRLFRDSGLDRNKVRREIKGPVLEPIMWGFVKRHGGRGNAGSGA